MLVPLLLLSSALALSPDDEAAIFQIEANRLPPLALELYVGSEDAPTRARAARALGRLRTIGALVPLRTLVADADEGVRAEAAFALGQTPESERILLDSLATEPAEAVRAALCRALGLQGSALAVPPLSAALGSSPRLLQPPVEAAAAAAALGRLAMRGVPEADTPAVAAQLVDQLARFDRDFRRAAAFSLGRMGPEGLAPDPTARLLEALRRDPDPVVRAFLIRASTALALPPEQREPLYAALIKDRDAGVRVALARASAQLGWPGVVALLKDPVIAVRLEAIAAVSQVAELDAAALLRPLLDAGGTLEADEALRTVGDPRLLQATAALSALAARELLPATGPGSLSDALEPARPTRLRAAAASALKDRARLVTLAVQDGDTPVRTAAISRLLELEPEPSAVIATLDSFDAMVAAAASEWLSTHPAAEAEGPLLAALNSAKDQDLDLLALGADALTALYTGARPLVRKANPAALTQATTLAQHADPRVSAAGAKLAAALGLPAPAWQHHLWAVDLDEVSTLRTARVRTTRGEAILALYPEEAPLTVWNFAQLADRGYFDGLSFHRVVPDFVVQDGDPRGDGWGGPGYSIPDEISPRPFKEGAVGMALSGPDTGGSQWFVTLSPQPHLDAGYPLFGQVVSGMSVFQDTLPGDRILSIRVERSPKPPTWSGTR